MLTMIHNALAGRATRWIAVPTMAVAAGAALALTVSAGTIPGISSPAAARACSATRTSACLQPTVAQRLDSLHMAKPSLEKALPALPVTSRQPASPMTPAATVRQTRIQAALSTYLGTKTGTR